MSFFFSCGTKQLAANELPIANTKPGEDDSDTNSKNSEKLTQFVHPLSISEDDEDNEVAEKCDANKDEDSGLENEQDTVSKSEDKTTPTATSCTNNK